MLRYVLLLMALTAGSLGLPWQVASAQQPITIVVTTAPGGSVDAVARQIAQGLGKSLGRTVVVENRPGANGNIAAEYVRRAAPDGNTLLILSSSTFTLNPLVLDSVRFDPTKDFAPVAMTARLNMVLVANPRLGVNDVRSFIGLMKARPGALNYGSSGQGSLPQVAAALLGIRTGTSATHVPYKGIAPALTDLVSGQIDYMFDSGTAMSHINAGTLSALAVIGPDRLAIFPKAPTFREAGIHGMEAASGWHGIFAPANTPADVVRLFNSEINAILSSTQMRERMEAMGFESVAVEPAELGRAVREDLQRLGDVVRQAKIRGE